MRGWKGWRGEKKREEEDRKRKGVMREEFKGHNVLKWFIERGG